MVDTLKRLLAVPPAARPDMAELLATPVFNDVRSFAYEWCLEVWLSFSTTQTALVAFPQLQIRTLRYLETLLEKDFSARAEFLKRLPQVGLCSLRRSRLRFIGVFGQLCALQ